MKILLASAECLPFRGGVAEVAHGLAAGLSGQGFDVTALTRRIYVRSRTPSGGYRLVGYPFRLGMEPRTEIMIAALRLAAGLLANRTVLAADYITQRALSLLPAATLRARSLWLVAYGSEILQHAVVGRVARRQKLFRCCRGVIAISRYAADLVGQFFPEAPVHVVYPGIREELYSSPRDVTRVADIRRTVSGRFLILCVGRLDPRKGQDTLLDALPQLARQHSCPVVAFLGDGSYRPALERLAHELGVEDQVYFLGTVTDAEKIAWLDAADLVVQPSRQEGLLVEGLGLALAEAGARGKAVLASRHGGIPEVVEDDVTGVLVDENASPSTWAQAISQLLASPQRRQRLGEAAMRHVASRFRWNLAASATTRLILGLVRSEAQQC